MRFQGHRVKQTILPGSVLPPALSVLALLLFALLSLNSSAWGQSISSVRSFDGGVAPLFRSPGLGSLYLDNQGTQGFLYNPGNNFQSSTFTCPASYYFSRYPHCWGWATWRRAWKLFDSQLKNWPALRDTHWLDGLFPDPSHAKFWADNFEKTHRRENNSWAYASIFSCWSQSLLTVIPEANLVSNIGFGAASTHTPDPSSPLSNLPAPGVPFPLRHPACITRDHVADDYTQRIIFGGFVEKKRRFPGEKLISRLLGI